MTTEFKTKAQAKAENASQDTRSQDANKVNAASIPVIEGIEGSLEKLYALNRGEAHRLTQTVKVAAYKDEFQCAIAELEKGLVSPSFFENLQKSYSPVAINHVPMLLLTQSGVETTEPDTEIKALTDRFDELVILEQSSEISDEQLAELDEVEARLKELGELKR
jgi:multidrug efflux pump subunit AcrA (membrane-fusion protein)